MNRQEIGLKFELKAMNILKNLGYELIEHTSQTRKIAPYDLVMKKEGILYFIEVKGRTKNNKNFGIRNKQLEAFVYIDNIWIFLVNDFEHRFFSLEDSENKTFLNGFDLNLSFSLINLLNKKENYFDRLKDSKELSDKGDCMTFRVERLGEDGILILSKEQRDIYGIEFYDIIQIEDITICKRK